jgi:hypothetical protein
MTLGLAGMTFGCPEGVSAGELAKTAGSKPASGRIAALFRKERRLIVSPIMCGVRGV